MSDGAPLQELLSEVIDHRGRTPKKLGGAFARAGIPVLSAKSVKGGRIDLSDTRFVDEDLYERWMPRKLRPGDVLLTSEGPLGEVAYLRDADYCLGQRLFALRAEPSRLDGRFLFYWLKSAKGRQRLSSRATGTTVVGIRQSELLKVRVDAPSVERQRAIAGVLGALDDKIELNRRMNETLEAIARTAFEGVTPVGGEIAELGNHVEVVRGRSYKSSELGSSANALVTLKSFARGGGYRSDGLKPYNGDFKPAQTVLPGEIVVACTDVTQAAEVIGRPALVLDDPRFEKLVASLDLVIVRPREPLSVAFVYLLLGSSDFTEHAYAHTTGTTVLHLDRSCIPRYQFMLPPPDVVSGFDQVARPLLDRVAANHAESRTLVELRDTLLPKLISGELRVRDAAAAVEQAT